MEQHTPSPRETATRLLEITPNIDIAIATCDKIMKMSSLRWVRTHYLLAKGYLLLHKYMAL